MLWQDFDFDGKVIVPVGFYITLVYLLRGYVLWIISLTYAEDRTFLLSTIYPNKITFVLSIIIGLPALFTFFLFGLKTFRASRWYGNVWSLCKYALLVTLLVDLSVQMHATLSQSVMTSWIQMVQFIFGSYLCWYWGKSAKISRFFKNWLVG